MNVSFFYLQPGTDPDPGFGQPFMTSEVWQWHTLEKTNTVADLYQVCSSRRVQMVINEQNKPVFTLPTHLGESFNSTLQEYQSICFDELTARALLKVKTLYLSLLSTVCYDCLLLSHPRWWSHHRKHVKLSWRYLSTWNGVIPWSLQL